MEQNREETPINTGQQGGNIAFESSDGQETSGWHSVSITASSSAPEWPEKPTRSNESALKLCGNTASISCPDCDIKLDSNQHKFCYGCGKTMQEIVSYLEKKKGNITSISCPDCDIKLDPNVHKFCYQCGKSMSEIVFSIAQKQGNTSISCPDCAIKLDLNIHKFCYGCGKTMREIFSSLEKKQEGKSIQSKLPSLPRLNEVADEFNELQTARTRTVSNKQHTQKAYKEHMTEGEKNPGSQNGGKKLGANQVGEKESWKKVVEKKTHRKESEKKEYKIEVDEKKAGEKKDKKEGEKKEDKKKSGESKKREKMEDDSRRTTGSIAQATGETATPQHSGGGQQDSGSRKNATILEKRMQTKNPLSHGNRSIPVKESSVLITDKGGSAASYQKPERKEQESKSKQNKGKETKKSTGSGKEATLTVIFYAIVSEKFNMEDETAIVICGEEPVFYGWNNGFRLMVEKYMGKHLLVRGELSVPLESAKKRCEYKYVLLSNKNKPTYEEIVEYQSRWGGIVNRCLVIEEKYTAENKVFYKYDGFIYPKQSALSFLSSTLSPMNDRIIFFRIFFPNWSGFCVNLGDVEIQPVEALQRLECLEKGISEFWTSTSGNSYRHSVDQNTLKLGEVFQEILMPKLKENLKVLKGKSKDPKANVLAVVSSVVIAYVFTKYNVFPKPEDCEILLKCLRIPPKKEVCVELMKSINEFEKISSSFNDVIHKFYQNQSLEKSFVAHWLSALPLFHFFVRQSRPFKDVICEKSVNVKNWEWWKTGLEKFSYRDIRKNFNAREAITMLPDMQNIFDMDRLLKRTFLMLCPIDIYGDLLKTGLFSCQELCITMRKLLPDTKGSSSYTKDFVEFLALFFKNINQTLSCISFKEFGKGGMKETLVFLENLVYLVHDVKQHLKISQVKVLCRVVECLVTAVVHQMKAIDLEDESAVLGNKNDPKTKILTSFEYKDIPKEMTSLFKKQVDIVDKFIQDRLPVSIEYCQISAWEQELQAWNELLSLHTPDVFHKPWHTKFIDKFQRRIHKASPLRQIELFCQSDKQECNPDIATYLSNVAFKAVEKVVRDGQNEQRVFNQLTQSRSINGVKLLREMLCKAWPRELKVDSELDEKEKDEILLKHLLTWPTWPEFLKLFGSNSGGKEELAEDYECAILITMAETCLMSVIKSVKDGSVTVATLQLLKQYSESYFKLGDIHQKRNNSATDVEQDLLQRTAELDAFVELRSQLDCFIGLSSLLPSVNEGLRVWSEKIEQDIVNVSICDLCVKRPGGHIVTFFNLELEEKFCTMISGIMNIKKSRIFDLLWKKKGEKLNDEVLTMEVIFEGLWLPICDKLLSINQQFLSGDMLLKDVDKYLKLCDSDYEAFKNEFLLLSKFFSDGTAFYVNELERELGAGIKRVKNYKKLFDARDAAKAILLLRETIGLEGDFSAIENLAKIISGNFKGKAIKFVSDKLLEAGKLLEKITPPRRNCLMTFTKCFELVTWLRESVKDDQELKVFVDLAMISAGEEDKDIDRISIMHTSCLGYGSLIFGYRCAHGFDELMQLCEPVWQAVDANPTIDKQLFSTQQDLSWFKQIKESHGSVALTTMVQVEAINSSGIYYIADSDANEQMNNDGKLCLENLVCLVVPKDKTNKREKRIYSLEEIKDVHSKLMLIAGKADSGKEEVDQFNKVFEGILRISDLYMQLCEVGEIKYLTWKRKFKCSKFEDLNNEVLKDIDETCQTMETELKQWRELVNGKRYDCYSLNHFTVKQLLYLRKDLARACTGRVAVDKLQFQTFMLLETVDKSITPSLLAHVLKTSVTENSVFLTKEREQEYFTNDFEDKSVLNISVEEEMDPIQPRRQKNSIDTFTDARERLDSMLINIDTDNYLLAALHHCGRRATEDELICWVVSHENDDEQTVLASCTEAKKDPRLSDLVEQVLVQKCRNINDDEELLTTQKRKTGGPIVPPLENHYEKNEKDTYLSLDVLTDILEKLSESESHDIKRKFPSGLKEGEPNLLLVPKGEVFGCVLSLFMGTGNEPLPTDEEVIVCDENTTAEEIELLWRRAVAENCGLLFCLVNADLLDYDVSQQAVRSLEMLTRGHCKYHLVVICSIENETKSNMVASLDQFRRPFPPLVSMREIQKYLKQKLSVSDETIEWEPAATVDVEKLTVRVVQSSRAGMGKSLIVKHLVDQVINLPNNKNLREGLKPSLSPAIPVHGICVDSDRVTRTLLSHAVERDVPVSRIFHLDMSQSAVKGLDNFLFKLVILRAVKDHSENVWRRKPTDMYVIEITTDKTFETAAAEEALSEVNYSQDTKKRPATNKYSFIKFLPRTHCFTPRETLENMRQNKKGDTGFDLEKFQSVEYQRAFQYLTQLAAGSNLDQFSFTYNPHAVTGDQSDALNIIIQ